MIEWVRDKIWEWQNRELIRIVEWGPFGKRKINRPR